MSSLSEYGISEIWAIDDDFANQEIDESVKLATLDDKLIDKDEKLADFYHSNEHATLGEFFDYVKINGKAKEKYLNLFKPDQISFNAYQKLSDDNNLSLKKIGIDGVGAKNRLEELLNNRADGIKVFITLDKILNSKDPLDSKAKFKEILESINEHLVKNKNLFLTLFSTKPKNFENFSEVITYLKEELDISDEVAKNLALHINFINKNDYEIDDFITALRKSQKANFVNSFNEIFDNSMDELKNRLWDLNANESLFHYDYLVEGQHIDQIIYELFETKFNYSFNDYHQENYEQLINPIRNSIQKYTKSKESLDSDAHLRLRFIKEINNDVKSSNLELKVSKSDDISYGDIIEIKRKKYLVISQNCDLTLRNDGRRIIKNFNLIEIEREEEKINSEWLKGRLLSYLSERRIISSAGKIFKETFYSKGGSVMGKMGFENENLKKIQDVLSKDFEVLETIKANLSEFEFIDENLETKLEYKISRSKEIISIPCFWLDSLLIRQIESDDEIKITEENIGDSKEIRLATKKYLEKEFKKQIYKFEDVTRDITEQVAKKIFTINSAVPLDGIWESTGRKKKLLGFRLTKVKRIGKLDAIKTREIHKSILDYQIREAINQGGVI